MMNREQQTVYMKLDQCVEVTKQTVNIADLCKVTCENLDIENKINSMIVLKFTKYRKTRIVVSVLKIIERIHQDLPQVSIVNMGAEDIIVKLEDQKTSNNLIHCLKLVSILIITFTGAAYSIMAFSNDVGTAELFQQIYYLFTGTPSDGFTILELTYSFGLLVGILVFFNHFGRHKFTSDPTPMEVEMRLYEQDIQTTLIENYERKEQEIDVGDTGIVRNHRTKQRNGDF